MDVVVVDHPTQLGGAAAERVISGLTARPDPVIGVATGASPLAVYATLARRIRAGRLDLSGVRGFALDEYVGIPPDDSRSYAWYVREQVEKVLRMRPGSVQVPNGMATDLTRAAEEFDSAIAASGGVDVQILGLGSNGHIGFNEPGASLTSRTHVGQLADQTRADNARFFGSVNDVPRWCVTQGLATIVEARSVVLVAAGARKARAVAAMVEGEVTSDWPCSVLQTHANVTVLLDAAAASELSTPSWPQERARASVIWS